MNSQLCPYAVSRKILLLFNGRFDGPGQPPLLHAFNFVIDDVLDGGVNGSLDLDGHGKTNSFRLLSLPVEVPRSLVRIAR